MTNKFNQAVCEVVSQILPGRIMSYGEVACAAGYPRHARMVSRAMKQSPHPLPWHRVIKADRTLAFERGSESYIKQEKYLLQEGVKILKGKVIPLSTDKGKSLDEVLWGSPPQL